MACPDPRVAPPVVPVAVLVAPLVRVAPFVVWHVVVHRPRSPCPRYRWETGPDVTRGPLVMVP